ncbi:MAG: hypothetical protein LBE01_05890, partial [Deltaproteobacteria bacterium]|nr:hypothetical protein [Deltaproteobacteria bacterium]
MLPKTKLFFLILIPAVLALLVALAFIQDKNRKASEEQFEKLLYTSWQVAQLAYDQATSGSEENRAKAQNAARAMTKDSGVRLTVVDDDGTVSFDSEAEGELESHKDRPEFKAALKGQPIFVTRKSETLGLEFMYYAQRVGEGSILRVSSPIGYFERQRELFFRQALSSALILVVGVFLFSFWASRRLAGVYSELTQAVEAAKAGE